MQMENSIAVQGQMEFMGLEIPVVYGGFGRNQMCILAKTVAEIHGTAVGDINASIKRNRKRFKDEIDIIDLKNSAMNQIHSQLLKEKLGFTQAQINASKNIYLLSERGYAKLIKIMDTDEAWDIYEELLDSYFHMREEKEEQMKMETNETMKVDFTFGEAVAELYALTGQNWDKTQMLIGSFLKGGALAKETQVDIPIEDKNEPRYYSYTEIVKEKLTNVNKAQLLQILRDNGVINEIGSTAPKPEFVKKGWFEKVFLKTYYIGEEPYGERYDWRVTEKGLEEIVKMVEAHS